jgi:hypothetical protein
MEAGASSPRKEEVELVVDSNMDVSAPRKKGKRKQVGYSEGTSFLTVELACVFAYDL